MSGKTVRDTLGFLGVVASLVFVGMEVHQNTAATRGATQQELQMTAITVNLATANDQQLADLVYRSQTDTTIVEDENLIEGFTGGESRRIRNYFLAVYRLYEEAHYQYTLGNLDPEVWTGWRSNIALIANSSGGRLWPALSPRFSDRFRTFMDDSVRIASVPAAMN